MGMTADWVSGFGESYRVAFYTADGTTVFQDDYVAENIQFPADGWKAGVYYFSVKPEYDTYPCLLYTSLVPEFRRHGAAPNTAF